MVDDGISNPTKNTPFVEIAEARLSRRGLIGGSLATAAGSIFMMPSAAMAGDDRGRGRDRDDDRRRRGSTKALDFDTIPLGFDKNEVQVPAGFTATAFLPWGTAILPGAAPGDYPVDAADQAKKIGLGHDGMRFFPTNKDGTRGVLCMNHEYGTDEHIERGTGLTQDTPEFVALSQAVHGLAIVEIERTRSGWQVVMGKKNRRVTANTPAVMSGPAAKSDQLKNPAGNPVAGTINNCGNGFTPWGTYLTCEENFNGYFGWTGSYSVTEEQARYAFAANGFGYEWHKHDPRFDLANPDFVNEHKRFGWIVEVDPNRPDQPPVKRTALGRFKHENCEIYVGRKNRVVAYMGDDERFDYLYKFVSSDDYRSLLRRGKSPLDHGTLHVARFDADGTGTWIPLTMDDIRLSFRFADEADMLINTRIAADLVGATPMDRPEWAAVNPLTGDAYVTCTNNTRRTAPNPPNPRISNANGHIIKLEEPGGNIGTEFRWDIFVLSGPAGVDGSTTDADSEHGSPDGLTFDTDGIMYIQTDGGQPNDSNDQMLLADTRTGKIKRFLTGVKGCEVTGWTPLDEGTFMVNLQHPGDGNPAISNFPSSDPNAVPRDACVIVERTRR